MPRPVTVLRPFTPLMLAGVLLLSGCISLSTFQLPRILEPDERQAGAGMLLGVDLQGTESGPCGFPLCDIPVPFDDDTKCTR